MEAGVKNGAAVRFDTTFRAFENRNFVRMWFGNCLSDTSRWMQLTLLAWLVLELTDSPWSVSLVGFFLMFPTLVLGLVGGVLADEVDRRRLLIMMLGTCVAACLGMTLLLADGAVKTWQAYLTILITGTAWALGFPSRRALLFDLLGASGITNAVALDTVGMNISRVLGPGLGGVLISLTGVVGGYTVVTLFYTISLVLFFFMRVESLPQHRRHNQSLFRNLMEGFRYIRQTPSVLAVVWITVAMNFLLFPFIPMVSVMARDVLHVGPTLMGILQAAQGFGAVIGAILIASAGSISFHGRIFVGGALFALTGLGLFAVSPWYFLSFPSLLLLGLGVSGFTTIQSALVMLVANKEMRGRALGAVSLAIGAGPLGSLMLGAMASWIGPVQAIALNSLVGVIVVTVIAISIPSIIGRTQPD
jgi:MFS family permease